jgi:hypothetical protein
MSTSEDSMDTTSPSAPTDGKTIGECLLDVLCVKHSSKPGGLTIYEDSLRTNIIGELSLKEFLTDNQAKSPTVRTAYAEVQEINRVSYRSLYFTTKIGKRHIPVTAKVIPGMVLPLLVGMNFRDDYAESPATQRQVNDLKGYSFFMKVRFPLLRSP